MKKSFTKKERHQIYKQALKEKIFNKFYSKPYYDDKNISKIPHYRS